MGAINRWSLAAALLACALAAGCHESRPAASGNSNWLNACRSNSDCTDGLSCICGLCTLTCADTAECPASDEPVTCVEPVTGFGRCAIEVIRDREGICLHACDSAADCDEGQSCQGGGCIAVGLADAGSGIETPPPATDAGTEPPRDATVVDACDPALESCGPGPMTAPDAGPVRAFEDIVPWSATTSETCEANGLLIDSGSNDAAWAIAVTADSVLVGGMTDTSDATSDSASTARIERRRLADLAPAAGFGTSGAIELDTGADGSLVRALAADSEFVYSAGGDWSGEAGFIRIEKRSLATGALAVEFGNAGVLLAEEPVALGEDLVALSIALSGGHLFTTGATFGVEKRNASDGSLVSEFGALGVTESSAAAGSIAQALAVRDGVLYVAGSEGLGGLRLEARDGASGELVYNVFESPPDEGCGRQGFMALAATDDALYLAGSSAGTWHIERRRRTDGMLVYTQELPSTGNCEYVFGIAVDADAMYLAGTYAGHWRIEKRSLVDGELVEGFGVAGVIQARGFPTGAAQAIAVQDGLLYVAGRGYQRRETASDWRIERRSPVDGGLLECPSWTRDVPRTPNCGSTPTVESAEPIGEQPDCDLRVASSVPCSGINVRASVMATDDEDWRLHYAGSDNEDWGLAAFGTLGGRDSGYLVARGFGFDLPDDARVLGIALDVTRDVSADNLVADREVRLVKGSEILDGDRARPSSWSTGSTHVVHGAANDLWDSTWTAAQINDPGFGVALRVHVLADEASCQFDELQLRVYYCE